jgi:NADP-dependent 3-hydroxy acid dehydrogenase YdfG
VKASLYPHPAQSHEKPLFYLIMLNLTPNNTAFPAGSLVLVTGASGFIGMHIVEQLLLAGYHVRGTVRDEMKAAWTSEFYGDRHRAGQFSAVVVPEMSADGAFDEAVKGN